MDWSFLIVGNEFYNYSLDTAPTHSEANGFSVNLQIKTAKQTSK